MKSNLYSLLNIPHLSTDKNYWIIRSNGGMFYEDFVMHDYIAIAWDYISINIMCSEKEETIRAIIESSEKTNPSFTDSDEGLEPEEKGAKTKITTIFNKLQRFINEFSIGDIVLVPSKDSEKISIGVIKSPVYEDSQYVQKYLSEDPDTALTLCPYYKRRKVKWIKHLTKHNADIYLLKAFNSQHALSNMNDYAPFIDRAIYPIYSKGNELHSTIHAGHPKGVSLKELSNLINNFLDSINDISQQCDLNIQENDIQVKLNIHSPGLIELIGYGLSAGITISIIMFTINHLINGGKLNISFKKDKDGNLDFSVDAETKGLKGRAEEQKKLALKEQLQLKEIIKDLDIKDPNLISTTLFHYDSHQLADTDLDNTMSDKELKE